MNKLRISISNRQNLIFSMVYILLFAACTQKSEIKQEVVIHADTLEKITIIPEKPKPNYADLVNYTDTNGWKQGKWIRKWKGHILEINNYVNDTLHGMQQYLDGWCPTEIYYEKGKREGFKYIYSSHKKECIGMILYFENDSCIWSGFPCIGRMMYVPDKDFHIYRDTVFIEAPYINRNLWYEGHFCLKPDSVNDGRLMPHRYGIHKIYHLNGNIRGIIDYTKKTVQEFDSTGKFLCQSRFDEYKVNVGRY